LSSRPLAGRRWLVILLGLAAALAVIVALLSSSYGVVHATYGKWREASNRGGQQPAEPFRIAGNLYYVGANDVTAFLITGPEGHVLIDGGYPGTPPLIMASIAKLGFKITDVKVLLNSHGHFDHAGGLAALQKASGAELWVSEGDADIVAAGGAGDPFMGPFRLISYTSVMRYPPPRVDHRFKDGATIHVGPIELTAHVTPGHSPGCTTWSFPVRDGDRTLLVVHACSLTLPPALSLGEYPEIRADFERTFRTLRSLPADIWVTSHAREFGRYRKFLERAKAKNAADPFIDRKGYLRYIDDGEAAFRKELADQQ
jgi:metallo-beta-lactamase class B